LSQYEKKQKIVEVYYGALSRLDQKEQEKISDDSELKLKEELAKFESLEVSVINKISVNGLNIDVVASASIPGRLNNQFALDEYEGNLRVATTIPQRWSRWDLSEESKNNVYVLDSGLNKIGEIKNIAKGESIFSTRFMGDRLYMVTFRQVDPFFVIDLSNPRSPKILGELKIPGFSRYLHPYDESTIIGIGQEASETGRITGLKISLFDVSDVANPIEIAKYTGDDAYAHSTALYEHKAFLFSKEKNLLVIPAYNYDYSNAAKSYNGALVFNLQKTSIQLRGLVEHSAAKEYYYGAVVERSLYIENVLYTVSSGLIRANDIGTLGSLMNISLVPPSEIPRY
jgi:inhibitor of cysteine peptidase